MTKIYLEYNIDIEVTREPSGEWDNGETCSYWYFTGVSLSKDLRRWESYDLDFEVGSGDTIWLVIAIWSTGDSFGYDEASSMDIMGGFKTKEEAEALADDLRGKTEPDYSKDYNEWLPWHGYFDSLYAVKVEEFVVKP